jgi:serine/threonine protein kinase
VESETPHRIRAHVTEGRVISGRYRLLSKLGQGGMGSVYRALHLELQTPVAIKLIEPTVAESKQALARFKREARAAASLRSNNVVQILDYGVDDATPYIVMELLEGESLAARIARQGVLSPLAIINVVSQVGKALERAHAMNIVHRDLKPDNIFLTPDGEDIVAKVLDFGIAKTETSALFEGTVETKSGAILGTPHYMSPEQASGRGIVDYRADIWALGVIVFECFTGFRPFTGNTLGGLVISICSEPIPLPSERGSVPRGLDAWFTKAVSRNKNDRFSSMTEAVASLRHVCVPEQRGSFEYSLNGLGRETTVVNDDENSRTVSPSTRTVGSISKRHTAVKWGIFVVLAFVVGGVTVMSRKHRPMENLVHPTSRNPIALRPEPANSKPVDVSASSAVPSNVLSPQLASDLRGSPLPALTTSAKITESPRGVPPSRPSSKMTGKLPSFDEKREDPSGLMLRDTATPPANVPTQKKPESIVVETPKSTESTRRTRNIEDRLAF